jgi:hypothetical protein
MAKNGRIRNIVGQKFTYSGKIHVMSIYDRSPDSFSLDNSSLDSSSSDNSSPDNSSLNFFKAKRIILRPDNSWIIFEQKFN